MSAQKILQAAVDAALADFDVSNVAPETLQVVAASNPQFGDYQWNGALPLAKALKQKPRDIATRVLEKLDVSSIAESPEIAGPGFLNFRLKTDWLEQALETARQSERLGVETAETPQRYIVDFSSPNVAKPMHVGHIRSTIIGAAIVRMLRFQGHEVISDNHIGDWGTAFGKIIVGWKSELDEANLAADPIGEMERLYKLINERGKTDSAVEDAARFETAKLQAGDAENLAIWGRVRDLSQQQFDHIYSRLDISFDETLGESFYNPRLPSLVNELIEQGLARESNGAIAIFSDRQGEPKDDPFLIFTDGEWRDAPALIRKSDGASLYATTDLATLEYRIKTWQPDEIVYVTDARQAGHFKQFFAAFRRWMPAEKVRLYHVAFGMILGEDRTPLKTREGGTVKLAALLDEAVERSLAIVREKQPDLDEETAQHIAQVVGISAVKYADLSQNRASDYIFSWDKMLAMTGNSAVYMLYAYARPRSIFRKAQAEGIDVSTAAPRLTEPGEIELAKVLLRFDEALTGSLRDYRLNILTDYIYELAGAFSAFYRDCRVLDAPDDVRASRLALCDLTARTLQQGLQLLGIQTLEQM
ncbi:arginine--tRNA ligase [bacterium]|nr:MAG: arginine--tRNA ligase [bacterium]